MYTAAGAIIWRRQFSTNREISKIEKKGPRVIANVFWQASRAKPRDWSPLSRVCVCVV